MWKMKIFVNMWKGHFYSLKTLVHLLEGNQAIYLRLLKRKTNFQENANSCSKSWVNPFKKLEIFSIILKWHFCSLKCIFSPLAHNKTIYLYRGLQGVTRGYRGLRGVTRGYRGLQGVTKGYKGFQGVTGERESLKWSCQKKNLIKPSMLSILEEKHSLWKMLIFDQNHRLTPLQKCKFFDHVKRTFF